MRALTRIFTSWISWNALWRDTSARVAYGLAALLALAFIAYLFPLSFLAGQSAFFDQVDASQHVAGWLFYVRDSWHFPLLHTERLNHPTGVSIAFTDSIPIAALLFKSIRFLLPAGFHYIGWWHALAILMQGLGATFLIRALGVRHVLGTVCASGFALTWPTLLWRLGHTSLMTHALLLFAAGAYFLGQSGQWRSSRSSIALLAASVAGLMIHPYLMAFCYTVFLAFLVDQALRGESTLLQFRRLVLSIVVIGFLGATLGYFGNGTTTTGFGYYSMNLSAPICGGRFFSCVGMGPAHQFSAYHFADATGGQYEGFNYFGAGLLLLLPFAIAKKERTLPTLVARYPALILACVLLTLYALSDKIYLGGHEILTYALPSVFDNLTGTFRASGRFFWMVGYLILFGTLATLLKKPSWRGLLVLTVALPLQWFDTQALRQRIVDTASAQGTNDVAPWKNAMAGVDKLHIYPAYGCGDGDTSVYWFFQKLAAHYGKLIDTGYIARANVDCESNARSFNADLEPGHLYIMSAALLKNPFAVPLGLRAAARQGECVRWREAIVCQRYTNEDYWQQAGLPARRIAALDTPQLTWTANELATHVGMVQNGRLVPSQKDRPGFLSYGPYITLSPGRYHYAIRYASASTTSLKVGQWDVVANTGKDMRKLGAGSLYGTDGQIKLTEGTFEIANWSQRLEIRTHFDEGDLQLIDVSLGKSSH